MALITVVTAARNAASYLPETIDSIRTQTFPDWKLVVVDDASTDETADIAHKAAEQDPRVEVVQLEHSVGAYAAANRAMLAADSKYLARIDADDIALPRRFDCQLETLRSVPGKRACTGAFRRLTTDGLEPIRPVPVKSNPVIKWMMWFRSNLLHSTLLIETACFQDFGGYGPERVGEDFRTWSQLVRSDLLAVSDELLVSYRISPTQMTAATDLRDQPARIRITLDHMLRCDPEGSWTFDDADDIRWIGEPAAFTVERGLDLLGRFEHAWRQDATLTAEDRAVLTAMTASRRFRHLRRALGTQRLAVPLAAVQHPVTLTRSAIALARNEAPQWP